MKRKTYQLFLALAVIAILTAITVVGISIYRNYLADKSGEQQTESGIVPPEPTSPTTQNDDSTPVSALPEGSTFEIHFFDVGEADSALVECDGHYMLIDGGNPGSSSFLYSYLQSHGIDYLDYIVCSHAHADHVGGLAGALNYASVGTAYAPVTEYDSRAFNSFVKYLSQQGKEITVPSAGDCFELGNAKVTIFAPIDMTLAALNENNSSIILRIEYGSTSFLFTGDAEIDEELSVVESQQVLQSTLLKVGHHGSYTSTSEDFLKAVNPEYAIISVGSNNEYGHPHDIVLNRLSKYCQEIYRTDIVGEIICSSDGEKLTFSFKP